MAKLSKRLEAILSLVDHRHSFWDFCCDHGDLGIEAARRKLACEFYFVDQVDAIIKRLKQKLKATDIPSELKVLPFCEDSTKSPKKFSNSTIVLAGIGEKTALSILDQWSLDDDCELVLSIHSDNYQLRQYLRSRDFKLLGEQILKDKGKHYELLKLSPSQGKEITKVGASMWDAKNPASLEYLDRKIKYLKTRLSHQNDGNAQRNLKQLEQRRLKLSQD